MISWPIVTLTLHVQLCSQTFVGGGGLDAPQSGFFYSYCFQRILAIAILSVCLSVRPFVRPSVCLSITLVDQSKTVQARIAKSSTLAAWKTLVTG